MTEHFPPQFIDRFQRRAVSPEDLTTAESHLGQCKTCRQELAEAMRINIHIQAVMADLTDSLSEFNHPGIDVLVNYVENRSDDVDSENIKTHLEFCQTCADDVRDLQEGMVTDLRSFIEKQSSSARLSRWKRYIALAHWPAWPAWFTWLTQWRMQRRVQSPLRWVAIILLCVAAALPVTLLLIRLTSPKRQTESTASSSKINKPADSAATDHSAATDQATIPSTTTAPPDATLSPHASPRVPTIQESPKPLLSTLKSQEQLRYFPRKSDTLKPVLLSLNGCDKKISEELSLATRSAIKTAIETQSITRPAILTMLFSQKGVLSRTTHEEASFKLLYPTEIVIAEDRPTFQWKSVKGVISYQVNIVTAELEGTETSPKLSSTTMQWTPRKPLKRGVVYSWTVSALKNKNEPTLPKLTASEGRFKILEREKMDELNLLRRAGSHLGCKRLACGVFYAQQGMVPEAENEFSALAKANSSLTAKKMLRVIRSWSRN